MDMNELKRRERWSELAATIAQADHNKEAKARRHRTLRFWFSPWQVADEPTITEPTPEASAFVSGVGSGAADSQTPVTHTTTGFIGPAGPTTPTVRPVRGQGPATPHHCD